MQRKYTCITMIMLYLKFNIGKKSGIRHDNLSKKKKNFPKENMTGKTKQMFLAIFNSDYQLDRFRITYKTSL